MVGADLYAIKAVPQREVPDVAEANRSGMAHNISPHATVPKHMMPLHAWPAAAIPGRRALLPGKKSKPQGRCRLMVGGGLPFRARARAKARREIAERKTSTR